MKKILSAVAFAGLLLSGGAHAATLVLDGDFANANPTFSTISSGSSFGPWTVTSGSVDLIGGYWNSPTAGGGSVDVDGVVPGAFQQVFTAPAGSYVLSFDLSGNPDGGVGTKYLEVSVGGANQEFTYTVTGANARPGPMLYTPETLAFSSSGGPVTLSFASLDAGGSFGPVVGGVSVSAVPLPASFLLFGTGLAGLFMFARRRQAAAKV